MYSSMHVASMYDGQFCMHNVEVQLCVHEFCPKSHLEFKVTATHDFCMQGPTWHTCICMRRNKRALRPHEALSREEEILST